MAALGQTLLLMLLVISAWCCALAILAARRRDGRLLAGAEVLAYAVGAVATAATALLAYAFIVSDYSLVYVQQHSERAMPLFYRLTSVWGGQEGSLLVWAWLLGALGAFAVRRNRHRLRESMPHIIAVLMGVMLFFAVLLVTASNPFLEFLIDTPVAGKGLNPLLQDPYMVSHPPALYLGYTAMAIPFAFAFGSLISGQTDDSWIAAALPWVRFAWYFLGLGLILGMLWAYRELGWGGYWGWDPVENAGLFPWLTSTALLHSMAAQRQRGLLRVWTPLLALLSFVMTIFGTFLTRSGFIESVHAFSRSNIGYVFLAYIALVLAFGFAVLAWRWRRLRARHRITSALGREMWFAMTNWALLGATLLVLLLTVFPTISELFGPKRKIEPEAFNQWMAPVGLALLVMMAVCPLLGWRRTSGASLRRLLALPLGFAAATTVGAGLLVGFGKPLALAVWALCAMVLATILQDIFRSVFRRAASDDDKGLLEAVVTLVRKNRVRYGAYVVHLGVAMMCLGFAGEALKTERQAALQRGQRVSVGGYTLRYDGLRSDADAEKRMLTATMTVFAKEDGENLGTIQPAIWTFFRRTEMPTSEIGLRRGLGADLYVALGNADPKSEAASFKVVINPLVNWIWIGFIVLSVGATSQLPALRLARRRRRARSMSRLRALLAVARPVLPLAFAVFGLVSALSAGDSAGAPAAAAAGAALGLTLYLLLLTVTLLVGHLGPEVAHGADRAGVCELDHQLALRSLRDVELDLRLGKLEPELAEELSVPLRERLARLDAELAAASGEDDPLTREILAAVHQRLGDGRAEA